MADGLIRQPGRAAGGMAFWYTTGLLASAVRTPAGTPNAPATAAAELRPTPLALPEGYIPVEFLLPYRGPILGGNYRDVRASNVGGDVHHMPAASVSPLAHELGPAIHMPTPDDARTASYGNTAPARAYRARQRQLIDDGRFMEAFRMDVENLRSLFGNRYHLH